MDEPEIAPISFYIKRSTLFGAACGMFLGLLVISPRGVTASEEIASIVLLRNCILSGAALGLIVGTLLGWKICSEAKAQSTPAESPLANTPKP